MRAKIGINSKTRCVRQKRRKLGTQLYISVIDEIYMKILDIQEKDLGFKYSTYLRSIVEKAIDDKYGEIYLEAQRPKRKQ